MEPENQFLDLREAVIIGEQISMTPAGKQKTDEYKNYLNKSLKRGHESGINIRN